MVMAEKNQIFGEKKSVLLEKRSHFFGGTKKEFNFFPKWQQILKVTIFLKT